MPLRLTVLCLPRRRRACWTACLCTRGRQKFGTRRPSTSRGRAGDRPVAKLRDTQARSNNIPLPKTPPLTTVRLPLTTAIQQLRQHGICMCELARPCIVRILTCGVTVLQQVLQTRQQQQQTAHRRQATQHVHRPWSPVRHLLLEK